MPWQWVKSKPKKAVRNEQCMATWPMLRFNSVITEGITHQRIWCTRLRHDESSPHRGITPDGKIFYFPWGSP